MEKGGVRIENTILFRRYQLGLMFGKGRSGTVWLTIYIKLEEFRHFCTPIVYDSKEDLIYNIVI